MADRRGPVFPADEELSRRPCRLHQIQRRGRRPPAVPSSTCTYRSPSTRTRSSLPFPIPCTFRPRSKKPQEQARRRRKRSSPATMPPVQEAVPLVTFIGQSRDSSDEVVATVDAFDPSQGLGRRQPVLSFIDYKFSRPFQIHASCDGLIVLSLACHRFYICNPATLQWMELSTLTGPDAMFGGLYRHPSSDEYRVLFYRPDRNRIYHYYILKVGSPENARNIGQPADSALKKVIKHGLKDNNSYPSVLLHDCLHWKKQERVIVFDIMDESFSCMPSPVHDKAAHLLQVDGTLGMGHVGGGIAKLWVLQNDGNQPWSLIYNIKLPVDEIRNTFESEEFNGIVISKNGDVIVTCYRTRHLFLCDNEGKVVKKFEWDEYPELSGHWFKKSPVRHDFFETQSAHQVTPRFFRGLGGVSR